MAKPIHCRAFEGPVLDDSYAAYREERAHLCDHIALMTAQIKAATALRMPLVYCVVRREAPVVKIGTSVVLPNRPSWTGRLGRFGSADMTRLVAVTPWRPCG